MSLREQVASGFSRLTAAILVLQSSVPAATPVTATKPLPVDGDQLLVLDSEGSGAPVLVTKAQLLAALTAAVSGKQAALVSGGNIKTINGVSPLGAGNIVVAGGGGGEALAPLGLWDYWYYLRLSVVSAAAPDMFIGAPVSSGTNTTAIPAASQFGYNTHGAFIRSGTTANGGYRYYTSSVVADFFSGISHKFRLQFLWRTSFTGRTVRIGYLDTASVADAVDGVYFEVLDNVCTAKTASNGIRTSNATTLELSLDVAYTFDIDVSADGLEARYRVYAGTSTTPVFDVVNTTNIPASATRAMGAGIVATESSTTASDIGVLYGLGMGTIEGFARLAGVPVVVAPVATAPDAFTSGQWDSTPGDAQIVVNITALPADGGSAITALEYTLNGSTWTAFAGVGTSLRTITSLTNATAYPVQIRAVNAVGNGAASDTKSTTPVEAVSSGLSIVQEPDKATNFYGTTVTRSLTAVGNSNHLVVVARAPTAVGAPVLSDSAGGSWGAPVHSYTETGNGSTAYYFIRSNVTSGLTSVTATVASAGEIELGVVEVSGGTPVLDATGGELQAAAATVWNHAFTSTEDDVLFIGMGALSNGATAAGTAPVTSSTVAADFFYYARGLFPTAGSNTAVVTLSDVRTGARSWVVVRAS